MDVKYQFVRLVGEGRNIEAEFQEVALGLTGFILGMFRSPMYRREDELGCIRAHQEYRQSTYGSAHTNYENADVFRQAAHLIRDQKTRNGVPLDGPQSF